MKGQTTMFGRPRKEIHVIYHGVGEQKRRARRRLYAFLIGACLLIAVAGLLFHFADVALLALVVAVFTALTATITSRK